MNELYIKVEDLGGVIEKYFKDKDYITVIELISKFEDLSCDLDRLEEEYEDYKNYVDDNYKERSPYGIYGVRERDFH